MLSLLAFFALSRPASAAVSPQAREHFERARAFMTIGDFRAAAQEFEEAYKWSSKPSMLYDAGYAYRQLALKGDESAKALAVDCFQRYLAALPYAKERGVVQGWIGEFGPPAPGPKPFEPTRAVTVPDKAPPVESARVETSVTPPREEDGLARVTRLARPSRTVEGSLVAGLAVGMIAVGAGAWKIAVDGTNSCSLVPPAKACPEVWDTARGGTALVVIGGALALGAAGTLTYLELRARRGATRAGIAPRFGRDGAFLLAYGQF